MGLRGGVELCPREAGAGAHGPTGEVDLDALERAQVDHDAVVAYGVAGPGVAAGAHGDRKVVSASVAQHGGDVAGVGRLRDHRRTAVDRAVEHGASGVVVGIVRGEDTAGERLDVLSSERGHARSIGAPRHRRNATRRF